MRPWSATVNNDDFTRDAGEPLDSVLDRDLDADPIASISPRARLAFAPMLRTPQSHG